MIFSKVDLPEPFSPSTPILAPGKKDRLMSRRMVRFGGTTLDTRFMVYIYWAISCGWLKAQVYMNNPVAVVIGERLARYGFPDGHPFGPDRHAAFLREFEARGLQRNVQLLEPREASYEELLAFHTPRYVDFVRERSQTGQGFLDGGDTPAFRGVFEAAATVVGASITASDAIMSGTARAAFVPIAGLHHAGR